MWTTIRHGWRFLTSKPLFTFAVVATLALGIGVNTATFAIVYSVLLRPLPYQHSEHLVKISDVQGHELDPLSYGEFVTLSARPEFQSVAAYFNQSEILTDSRGSQNVNVLRASVALLNTLEVRPAIGPGFSHSADRPGSQRELMLSSDLWRREYRSNPNVIGEAARLGEQSYVIVGVLPPAFQFVKGTDVLLPLRLNAEAVPPDLHFLSLIGRMRAGLTPDRATAELAAARANIEGAHGVQVTGFQQQMVSEVKQPALLLFGATCLILLIASTNAANLLLVRSVERRKEVAIRLALGASRGQVMRQFFTEAASLSLAGAAAGAFLAWVMLGLTRASGLLLVPRGDEVALQGGVLLFTVAVSVPMAVLLHLGPAFQWRIENLNEPLRSARQSGPARATRRSQELLVVAEVSLTVILLCGTGLLIRSFSRVMGENKGFTTERVVSLQCSLTPKYQDPHEIESFYNDVQQRLTAIPYVQAAGLVSSVPLTSTTVDGTVTVPGSTGSAAREFRANKILANRGYFAALQIPLLAGRLFDNRDSAQGSAVAIVDETLARQACGRSLCLGQTIDFGWGKGGLLQIIGIVGPVRQDSLELRPRPTVYAPVSQHLDLLDNIALRVVARTSLDPGNAAAAFRTSILAIDKYQPPPDIRAMAEIVDASLTTRKVGLTLMGLFAGLATFLSVLGVYGTMSCAVGSRAGEFGLRMALGAQRHDILVLVLRQGIALASMGLVLGFIGAAASTRLLSSLLYGVRSLDPISFAAVTPVVLGVVLFGAFVPARTACSADPSSTLKSE